MNLMLLVSSIVFFFPLLSACLSYLPSLSVLFILSLPFFPFPPSPFLIYFFPLAFPFFLYCHLSFPFFYSFLFSFLLLFVLFPLSSFHFILFSLSSSFSSLLFLSDLPSSFSFSLPPPPLFLLLESSHQLRTSSRATRDEKGLPLGDHRFRQPSSFHPRTSSFQHKDSE